MADNKELHQLSKTLKQKQNSDIIHMQSLETNYKKLYENFRADMLSLLSKQKDKQAKEREALTKLINTKKQSREELEVSNMTKRLAEKQQKENDQIEDIFKEKKNSFKQNRDELDLLKYNMLERHANEIQTLQKRMGDVENHQNIETNDLNRTRREMKARQKAELNEKNDMSYQQTKRIESEELYSKLIQTKQDWKKKDILLDK